MPSARTTISCASAAAHSESPHYRLLGLTLAIGALFSEIIYLFWPLLIPFFWVAPPLWRGRFVEGFALSLLGLLPRSFATIPSRSEPLEIKQLAYFFYDQVVWLSPLFFLLLMAALAIFLMRRRRLGLPLFFCGVATVVPPFLGLISLGYSSWSVQLAFLAYPTAALLLSWYACDWLRERVSYLLLGSVVSVLLTLSAFAQPLEAIPLKAPVNPSFGQLGWTALEEQLRKDGYDPEQHLLFSSQNRSICSLLSFYSEGKRPALLIDLCQAQARPWKGSGFLVAIESLPRAEVIDRAETMQKQLEAHFRSVQLVGCHFLQPRSDGEGPVALVFRCM